MARSGFSAYGPKADKLARLAVLERSERDIASRGETPASPFMRLALGAVGGMFFFLAQYGAIWAWLGAASFMLAVCGSGGAIAVAAGALTAAIGSFHAFDYYQGEFVFWLILCIQTGAGAGAGVLVSLISRRLPPQAFAFLAALVPAGLEHLASFGANGPLTSMALTQYGHPSIVCIGRLGGLAGVTYVIFLFGGAVAVGIRHIREMTLAAVSAGSAMLAVLAALLFGALSGASTDDFVRAAALNMNSRAGDRRTLLAAAAFDAAEWEDYCQDVLEQTGRMAGKQIVATAMERGDAAKTIQLVVLPEAAVAVDAETRPKLMRQLEVTSRNNKCTIAMGYYDSETMESVGVVTASAGNPPTQYVRRRFESGVDDEYYMRVTRRGGETAQATDSVIGKVGVLLSLDANNFSSFASVARSGGGIVCVCGLDDGRVPRASLPLLVYNAALSGLAVVRSTHNGTLAAISPDGRILQREKTRETVNAQMTATVPLGEGRTAFLILGNLFAWLALVGGVGAGLYASTLPPGPGEAAGPEHVRPTTALSYKTKEGVKEV